MAGYSAHLSQIQKEVVVPFENWTSEILHGSTGQKSRAFRGNLQGADLDSVSIESKPGLSGPDYRALTIELGLRLANLQPARITAVEK